jgi:hypothetical protein
MKFVTSGTVSLVGFVCMVSAVFLMRSNDASPSRFLANAALDTYDTVVRTLTASRSLATGDATTKKNAICGSINPKDAFSASERSQAESFEKQLENLRGGNPLKTYINEGKGAS